MPTLTFSTTATGTGVRQDVDVVGSGHVLRADAYPDFGGQDAHPSPLALLLAALSSCTQVTGSVVARELGVDVRGWEVAVDGDFDPTVMVSGRLADEHHGDTFSAVRLRVDLDTDADQADVERLAAEVERRCPVSALFVRAGTAVDSTWTARQGSSARVAEDSTWPGTMGATACGATLRAVSAHGAPGSSPMSHLAFSQRVPFSRESATVLRHALHDDLVAHGTRLIIAQEAVHVLAELVMNSLEHGRPDADDRLEVSWSCEDQELQISVHDAGTPADGQVIVALDPSADRPDGRGLRMVEALSQRWAVERDGGTRVTAWLRLDG